MLDTLCLPPIRKDCCDQDHDAHLPALPTRGPTRATRRPRRPAPMTALPESRPRPKGGRAKREGPASGSDTSGLSNSGATGVNKQESARDAERALVEAAREDREAFASLYDLHFDSVYNYIARRVGDATVAEDIAASVWERALVAIERYESRGVPFVAWLYRIAGNLIANHHRRSRLWKMVPFGPQHARSRPQQRWDDRATVQAALKSLSKGDQEVLGLYYFAGLTPPEIALTFGCTTAAVHKRLHRARARLKKVLQGDAGVA